MINPDKLSRRQVLQLAGTMAAATSLPAWMPRLAFAQPYDDPKGDVLVVVFLRGGADTLNMIVPYAEDAYYAARPQLAIPRPDANTSDLKTLDLDGFFGLHPSLNPLLPIFRDGQMLAVHAAGSPHETRSHFEAMDYMERGTPGSYNLTTGWIARHLTMLNPDNPSPVRGIGWGAAIPTSLAGAPSTIAMQSIIDYHLAGDAHFASQMMASLQSLYTLGEPALQIHAQNTEAAVDVVSQVDYQNYAPKNGAVYAEDDFALALRQTAALIRAQIGLEAACIDLGGWDTHVNQGGVAGTQAYLMRQLAAGLAAFYQDMGVDMSGVSLVVKSEFGRRLEENASRGTDHGHGGAIIVMSGNLNNDVGPVYSRWPGLTADVLDRGDLAVAIDYRDILMELIDKRLKNPNVSDVFPGYNAGSLRLFQI